LMGKAFFNEALAAYILPNENERKRLLPEHFNVLLRHAGNNRYRTADEINGVCVWHKANGEPSEYSIPLALGRDLAILGEPALNRYMQVLMKMEALRQRESPFPHYYLTLLAVDPSQQRRGIGSKLIKPMLQKASHEKLPCYLWTNQPSSLDFYKLHGFKIVTKVLDTCSAITFWSMLRQPFANESLI